MRITKDNVEALYHHCRALQRHAAAKNDTEVINHAEGALIVLGFKKTGGNGNTELDRNKVNEFVAFWHQVSKYFYKWLSYQDESRDWFVNAEIKDARTKINRHMKELIHHLLDIVESAGKVYDK